MYIYVLMYFLKYLYKYSLFQNYSTYIIIHIDSIYIILIKLLKNVIKL